MNKPKVILSYSGGLDTSVAIKWLVNKGYDVIACCIDVGEEQGEGKKFEDIKQKGLDVGASKVYIVDALDEFTNNYLAYAIKGNTIYESSYPLVSALSRPLISKKLVEVAHKEDAKVIAHGCTGKGNDQARFETSISTLDPELDIIAPVREWQWSREEEIKYAKENGVPIPIDYDSPYSIDANIWGRANECGVLEDPYHEAPEDAFGITNPIEKTPDEPDIVNITFNEGIPVALNQEFMPLKTLIYNLNQIAGKHGIGRIDHIENRLVGIKSREIYEAPAAEVLIKAHQGIENLTLETDEAHFKPHVEHKMSNIIYNALWFSPLMDALKAFVDSTQQSVNGEIKLKLFKGNIITLGRKSDDSLYDKNLATYTSADSYDQNAATGFIKIWGLPTKVHSQVKAHSKQKAAIESAIKSHSKESETVKVKDHKEDSNEQ